MAQQERLFPAESRLLRTTQPRPHLSPCTCPGSLCMVPCGPFATGSSVALVKDLSCFSWDARASAIDQLLLLLSEAWGVRVVT